MLSIVGLGRYYWCLRMDEFTAAMFHDAYQPFALPSAAA
jgi:hypothetical protein